jgi:hypothetical protein
MNLHLCIKYTYLRLVRKSDFAQSVFRSLNFKEHEHLCWKS